MKIQTRAQLVQIQHQPSKTNLQPDIALIFQFLAIGVDFIDDELWMICLFVVVTFNGFVIVVIDFLLKLNLKISTKMICAMMGLMLGLD